MSQPAPKPQAAHQTRDGLRGRDRHGFRAFAALKETSLNVERLPTVSAASQLCGPPPLQSVAVEFTARSTLSHCIPPSLAPPDPPPLGRPYNPRSMARPGQRSLTLDL